MLRLIIILILFPTLAFALPDAPANPDYDYPSWTPDGTLQTTIYDDGYEGWMIEAYLGNFATKPRWYDGPRLEVGGLRTPKECVQGGGVMYCAYIYDSGVYKNVIEIDETTNIAKKLFDWTGKDIGPSEEVRGGDPLWNPYNETLYLVGPLCLRKVVDDGDGTRSVELVAGNCTEECSSSCDGTGSAALFHEIRGWTATSDGNMYLIEASEMRKVTPAGVVTTLTLTRPETPSNLWNFAQNKVNYLSTGNDPNIIYLADAYGITPSGYTIVEIDLSTNVMTRIAGVIKSADDYSRHGTTSDGPWDTHVGLAGGAKGIYSQFYGNYFFGGNDTSRLRRLTDDAWGKTVYNSARPGTSSETYNAITAMGDPISAEQGRLSKFIGGPPIPNYKGVDDRGGMYITFSRDLNIIMRSYNILEGGIQ